MANLIKLLSDHPLAALGIIPPVATDPVNEANTGTFPKMPRPRPGIVSISWKPGQVRSVSQAAVAAHERVILDRDIEKANRGDALTQMHLAAMYDYGEGVPRDYAEAAKWYRKAADQNNADAQIYLGRMYEYGDGIQKDGAEALKWYLRAAEQGHPDAYKCIGRMHEYGHAVPRDHAEAAKWFRKAANLGDSSAKLDLGVRFANGQGIPQDYVEAAKWFHEAAEFGHSVACFYLGFLYEKGQGVQQDFAKAAKWYRVAATIAYTPHAASENNLGILYERGQGVPQDFAEGMRWLRKAASHGNAAAEHNIALMATKNYDNTTDIPRGFAGLDSMVSAIESHLPTVLQIHSKTVSPPHGKSVPETLWLFQAPNINMQLARQLSQQLKQRYEVKDTRSLVAAMIEVGVPDDTALTIVEAFNLVGKEGVIDVSEGELNGEYIVQEIDCSEVSKGYTYDQIIGAIKELREAIATTPDPDARARLRRRMSEFAGSVAVIRVGYKSKTELQSKIACEPI